MILVRVIGGYDWQHVLRRGKISGAFRVFKNSTEAGKEGRSSKINMVEDIITQNM